MTKQDIIRAAEHTGIDLVGFTSRETLEKRLPSGIKPSDLNDELKTVIVLAKHIPTGVCSADGGYLKQMCGGIVHRALEEAAGELAYWLEDNGYLAVFIPSLVLDFKSRMAGSNTPAGQGSPFLRHAAVACGLGTFGLNWMVLTPRFGPRVFLCGMMTDVEVEPDAPIESELCPGLEKCGRCAAVCPESAIPRSAPRSAPLHAYRGLDEVACARSSQPHGPESFVDYIEEIVSTADPELRRQKIASARTSLHWQSMAVMRQGAFTGCMRCMEVCPVGEDYEHLSQSPHRQADLPHGVPLRVTGNMVSIEMPVINSW